MTSSFVKNPYTPERDTSSGSGCSVAPVPVSKDERQRASEVRCCIFGDIVVDRVNDDWPGVETRLRPTWHGQTGR